MSDSDFDRETGRQREVTAATAVRTDQPAIGLVATKGNSEAIAATILRARRHELGVILTYRDETEALQFAKQLGVTVVEPTVPDDSQELRQLLLGAAEATGHPSLLFISEPERRVDFEHSLENTDGKITEVVYGRSGEPKGDEVLVGIPAYNEEETIANVVSAVQEYADTVLVVDDGSSDETRTRAAEAGAVVVDHERNQGYGAALKTLFDEADKRRVEHLVIIDADGQHDPSDIPNMVEHQRQEGADLVVGSRFVEGGSTDAPLYRRFGLGIVNVLTNLSMGVIRLRSAVSDTQSGFRVYNRDAISSLAQDNSIGEGMNASTDILYHAHSNNFEIVEVGTTVEYDVENASSQNPVSHGITLVRNILKTVERERPIMILGLPGFLFTMIGLFFGYWTFSNYINTGSFPIGLAVSSAVFGLAGIFTVFTAIILHALNQHLDE